MPVVSVIVPNYNHAQYLQQRIESILDQTYQDFELILLDDCSADNSVEVLKTYCKHPKVSHFIINEKNSGSTFKQWNKGVELAQGKYIWIAESDDVADSHFLEVLVKELETNSKLGLVYSHSKLIDSDGKITYENQKKKIEDTVEYLGIEYIKQKLSLTNHIWNASMMVFQKEYYPNLKERELYSSMKYCGDWFFYVILLGKNVSILEIQQTLNYYRIHNENVSNNALKSGLAFLEGLDVYSYIKNTYLDFNFRNTDKRWAKKYCRAKRNNYFSKQTQLDITDKMKQYHKQMYRLYYLFEPYYKLKERLK